VLFFAIVIWVLIPKLNIEDNIVKIEKEAEIIANFEGLIGDFNNPSETILS
jgi:hypothetical protein